MELSAEIRKFVVDNFYVADRDALRNEDSLLDAGIVDSTGVLEVIGFLEDTYSIKVEDEEMVPENLDSIERIVTFVGRKKAQGQAADCA